eukprot:CCRYP_016947-RA/>CCRYP_016947-RA protein AED:0.36 eAED:0.34 QI:0/0/0/1/1/0.5/2/0/423
MATVYTGDISAERRLEEQFLHQSEILKQYWEVEKNLRDKKKHTLLQKEHRIKEIKDRHRIELGKYKQTIKDQLFSNEIELSKNAHVSLVNFQTASTRRNREAWLQKNDLHEISARIDSSIRSHEDFKIAMRHWYNDMTTDLREQASRRIASLAAYSEKQFRMTREQHSEHLKSELKGLELTHDRQINDAMEKNKEEVHRMRNSWKKTVHDNLDTILQLRKDVEQSRDVDRETRTILRGMHNQNDNIIFPLENKRNSLQKLNSDLESYHEQKQDLSIQRRKLKCAEEELKEIEWNHEVLFQRLEALKNDHVTQKKKFHDSIYSAQQETNFQNLLLEQRIRKLSKNVEKSTAAITEILQRANISLDTIDKTKVPISDVVKDKTDHVKILQEDLKTVTAAHSALLKRSRELLEKYSSKKPTKIESR